MDPHPTDPNPAMLEARLIAQRRLLARLVAALPTDRREGVIDWLSQRESLRDGQEDPGAVPAEGMGEALALAEEFRLILRLARDDIHEHDGSDQA